MEENIERVGALTIGVPREAVGGEHRVALIPDAVRALNDIGVSILVESGAGAEAYFDDEAYFLAGARIESQAGAIWRQADILVKVQPPLPEEIDLIRPESFLISLLDPARDAEVVARLREKRVTAFSFNCVPRTTRAQTMDAMSSMSTIAGYKAVLLAANAIGRFFPMLMTAAGTIPPARVIVIGAGVAGLQALATARRLGAVTAACDARPAVREQIASVGASFIDMSVPADQTETSGGYAAELSDEVLRMERDAIREHVAQADVVICTAQVPGASAPLLIDEAMVLAMRPGSVIVDLASETGGNCAFTVPGETVVRNGIVIAGPRNVPSTLPVHASQMYSKNVSSVLRHVIQEGALRLNPEDEIVRGACITGVLTAQA